MLTHAGDANLRFLLRLARKTLEEKIKGFSDIVEVDVFRELPRMGVYLSLNFGRKLRGSVGHLYPLRDTLVEEVRYVAEDAARIDNTTLPLSEEELAMLRIEIHLVCPPARIFCLSHLKPKNSGLLVSSSNRTATVLPGLEGVDTPELQVAIACEKAGIDPRERIELSIFDVIRLREQDLSKSLSAPNEGPRL